MAENSPERSARLLLHGAILAGAMLVLLAALIVANRVRARSLLGIQTALEAIPTVITVTPERGPPTETLALPGSVRAYFEAPIYARTSGYLKRWLTDIGARVRRGQLLAEIDAPELDQQYAQARADLATAQANYSLAQTTDARWRRLLATRSVSKQDADEKAGDAAAKRATLNSARANVARLRDLESFKHVVAPFDGVVTERNTDIGALINAGESPGNALFRVADIHRLRVYVSVPQVYAAEITPGLRARLVFVEHPGRSYPAVVASTARALDPSSRTLQVELQADNTAGALFPGAYAEVRFTLPAPTTTLRLPVNALLFRATGLEVATVDSVQHVRLKRIEEGRDFGTVIEVLSGIMPDDRVILDPPDSISEGSRVRILERTPPTRRANPKRS